MLDLKISESINRHGYLEKKKEESQKEDKLLQSRQELETYQKTFDTSTKLTEEEQKQLLVLAQQKRNWLQQISLYNDYFAKKAIQERFVTEGEQIVDITCHQNVSLHYGFNLYYLNRNTLVSPYGIPTKMQIDKNPFNGKHIVVNGIYTNMDAYLQQAINDGGFTAGICTGENNKMYPEALHYYCTLLQQLTDMKKKYSVIMEDMKDTEQRGKILMLHVPRTTPIHINPMADDLNGCSDR